MQLIWFDKTISLAISLSGSNLDLGMFESPRRIDSESDHENRFCKNRFWIGSWKSILQESIEKTV